MQRNGIKGAKSAGNVKRGQVGCNGVKADVTGMVYATRARARYI